jgi:hypothetical protein
MSNQINRRKALKRFSVVVGGAAMSPALLSVLHGCQEVKEQLSWSPVFFNNDQAQLITEIADTILPDTSSPGAKSAGVHIFIDSFVKHCVPEGNQNAIIQGLDAVENITNEKYGGSFVKLAQENKNEVIKQIAEDENKDDQNDGFFLAFKRLTMMGYFNSERGAKEALAFLEIPGDYNGCLPLEDGQKAWSE